MNIKDPQAPIYIQIAKDIRAKVNKGLYQEGEQIPTEDEIAQQYGVSRMTARNSVTELVRDGIIFRIHGKGAFVSHGKVERNLNKITGFHEDMIAMGLQPSSKIIKLKKRFPTDKERNGLKIHRLSSVFEVKRIRYVDDIPYGFQKLIVPEYLVPDLTEVNLEKESLYYHLRKIEKPIHVAEQRMEAVMEPKINQILDIPKTIPFFFFERTSYLEEKLPVELLYSYFRGDKFSYTISLKN
ncbi:GntR family transcriptional regulator [Virgibacillus byunsanensis]|uniref:GntR family transcriptional regulator n=1 Tax=Virgibacillus byunsanensis TaxID=570945 RepID=A0ABW3LIX0_9BACI